MAMASAAMSIDAILPAFAKIRSTLGLATGSSATAGLITAFFVGMALGQIPLGLLADRLGRKPVLCASCAIFVAGAVGMTLSTSLGAMLAARVVWGLGAAGLRVATTAMVRDRFMGVRMAKEMAFVMSVFILVPVFAPSIGDAILRVANWQAVVLFCAAFGIVIGLWSVRMPETLPVERRQPLQMRQLAIAATAIRKSRPALAYTLALMPVFGVFSSYLASSERIVTDVFRRGGQFAVIFGASALVMGAASVVAGKSVERVGLERLIRWVLVAYTAVSAIALAVSLAANGRPSFWLFWTVFTVSLALHNVTFPNVNAAAMIPVGHVAATASAIIGTLSTLVGALIGFVLDQVYDRTVTPVMFSFVIAGAIATALVFWAHHGSE